MAIRSQFSRNPTSSARPSARALRAFRQSFSPGMRLAESLAKPLETLRRPGMPQTSNFALTSLVVVGLFALNAACKVASVSAGKDAETEAQPEASEGTSDD